MADGGAVLVRRDGGADRGQLGSTPLWELGVRNEELGIFPKYSVGADLCAGPFFDMGAAPSKAVGAAICRPGEAVRGWGTGGHIGPPLQGHASHSDLCCSHHAGNAGSFGERVGFILMIEAFCPSAMKGPIM